VSKKVVICFLLFAFLICLMGIKNSFALDNNGYFPANWNVLGNISWNNLWNNFGTGNPNALGTPTWNMLGEITSWDELGTSNWGSIGNNLWSSLGTYFGSGSPYAVGTPTWNMFGEITSWDELGTSNWGSSNEAEDLVNNLQEGVDELINEYFEWW